MMKSSVLFTFILLMQIASFAREMAEVPEINIAVCEKPPRIDGKLNDACWEKATVIEELRRFTGSSSGKACPSEVTGKHKVRVTRDTQWLYVAFQVDQEKLKRAPAKYLKHDQLVQREDNVQVSFDPGTEGREYYQFLVNKANTRADFLMLNNRRYREKWNIPWRSAVTENEKGWNVEMAIPFCKTISAGDVGKAKINFIVATFLKHRDPHGIVQSEETKKYTWAPLSRIFNEPGRFGRVKGLERARFKPAFLPFVKNVEIGGYYSKGKKRFYDVKCVMSNQSGVPGKVVLTVEEGIGGRKRVFKKTTPLQGNVAEKSVKIPVPVAGYAKKDIVCLLKRADDDELLQKISVSDSNLSDILSAHIGRSYYTTEKNVGILCYMSGLSNDILATLNIKVLKDKRVIHESRGLKRETLLEIPMTEFSNPGKYHLQVRVGGKGAPVSDAEVVMIKRKPNPGREWKVDFVRRVLLDNGKPFFPIGILAYGVKTGKDDEAVFRKIAETGFNTIFQWSYIPVEEGIKFLDLAKKYNLNAICFVDHFIPPQKTKYGRRGVTSLKVRLILDRKATPEQRTKIFRDYITKNMLFMKKAVEKLKNHPNLIAWYLFDEPFNRNWLEQCVEGKRIYDMINRLDGYHPVLTWWPYKQDRNWFDITGFDPYWVMEKARADADDFGVNKVSYLTWRAKTVANNRCPVFITPLSQYYSANKKRPILRDEQLCQSYLAVINGASGILYFSSKMWSEELWDSLKEAAKHLHFLGDAALRRPVRQSINYSPIKFEPERKEFPDVQAKLFRGAPLDGKSVLLVAANSRIYPVEVDFKFSGIKINNVKRVFSKAKVEMKANIIHDRLEPYGVRVFSLVLKSKLPEAGIIVNCVAKSFKNEAKPEHLYRNNVRDNKKNILPNPGFEQAASKGWPDYVLPSWDIHPDHLIGSSDPHWGLDTDNPYEGKYSLKMTESRKQGKRNLTGRCLIYLCPDNPVATTYTFSFWARANRECVLNTSVFRKKHEITLTKDWKRYSITGEIPASPRRNYSFYLGPPKNGNATWWIDAMQLEKGDKATEYQP